ncbi:MAG: hypothetical protein M3R00_09315, partial [Pseudomonadota bacterium]|nr:hypothetical protein [Pseudomonadota bacterium]
FTDHADALEQSCRDLVGTKVRDLKTGAVLNENKITADDCKQLSKVIAAVEFRKPIPCANSTILAKNPPKLCPFGTHKEAIFVDDFKNEQKNPKWIASHDAVDPTGFITRNWEARTGGSQLGANTPVYFARELAFSLDITAGDVGDCVSDQAGVLHLDSPKIKIPRDGGPIRLSLKHWVNMPDDFYPADGGAADGGNLKISVNGGPYQLVDTSAFTFNPYNTELFPADIIDNPMAGQPVFSGGDVQIVDPFTRSLVNLSQYVHPGDTIRLRFDMGTDFCTITNFDQYVMGWHLKKVQVYQCKPGNPKNPHDDDDD